MVAYFRQFLVVLLVLLQSAAPLVHAHTGGNVSQGGLHLHEFEALRLVVDGLSSAAVDHAGHAQSCVVDVGSAIKQPWTADDSAPVLYLFNNSPGFTLIRGADIVNFLPHVAGVVPEPFLSHNTSRAPPL